MLLLDRSAPYLKQTGRKGLEMKAYWFGNNKLRYSDNREVAIGVTHKVEPPIFLCQRGLHASKKIIDALSYAPYHMLYRVELGGEIIVGDDKVVATERTYLAMFNAQIVLREFARKQALINIEKIKPYCSEKDYGLIFEWLKNGDEKQRSAAWSAAKSAAWNAAWNVKSAESAAWSAVESAKSVKSAVWSAAWNAVESAVWSVVESVESVESVERRAERRAAWSAANKMLEEMIIKKTGWVV